jgi:hypothetical protein
MHSNIYTRIFPWSNKSVWRKKVFDLLISQSLKISRYPRVGRISAIIKMLKHDPLHLRVEMLKLYAFAEVFETGKEDVYRRRPCPGLGGGEGGGEETKAIPTSSILRPYLVFAQLPASL